MFPVVSTTNRCKRYDPGLLKKNSENPPNFWGLKAGNFWKIGFYWVFSRVVHENK